MRNYRSTGFWAQRAYQVAAVGLSMIGAFLLRFDLSLPRGIGPLVVQAVLISILVKLPLFEWVGFYRGVREFASLPDLHLVVVGNVGGSSVFVVVSMLFMGPRMPRSVWLIDVLLCFFLTTLVQFSVRIRNEVFPRNRFKQKGKGILIYGAGRAGAELVHEICSNPLIGYEVKGFLDDNPQKQNAMVKGVPVLGSGREARAVVQQLNRRKSTIDEIIIAMPSATGPQMRQAIANCRAAGVHCKKIPGVKQLLNGKVLTVQLRDLPVSDLLRREPVKLDDTPARAAVEGRSVLVTGAAGSIGSELCRQLARLRPACLVAFDQAESDLFQIENELREMDFGLELVTALGDIRDAVRVAEVLGKYKVDSIFHAAAYKHVPMMELHLLEAVRNNILGTWNLVHTADCHHVRSILMISSDKAINPVCVMGATKRVCERLVSAKRHGRDTTGASVRFGNVLGSNGSVVPIFQAQIAAGGPLKVTHPQACRYFMTVSEAVSLVLQAFSRGQAAEIFLLNMGEPIRIVELAENMIRLAGLVPYDDIDIQFTGLRPGEKLLEEIHSDGKGALEICQGRIRVINEQPLSWEYITGWVAELEDLLSERREPEIIEHIRRLVPEYRPSEKLSINHAGQEAGPTREASRIAPFISRCGPEKKREHEQQIRTDVCVGTTLRPGYQAD